MFLFDPLAWIVAYLAAQQPAPAAPPSPASPSARDDPPAVRAPPRELYVGDVIEGEVRADSPVVHTPTLDRSFTDAPVRGVSFELDLPAGTTTIELRSHFFDAYLVVRDANGELIAEDDDGLLRTHSAVTVTRAQPAEVLVEACALDDASGRFELAARAGEIAALDPRARAAEIEDARRAVKECETVLGPEHPDTAGSLNSLATLLESMGQYEEARRPYECALAICEKVLGPEHPDTATSLNNLAGLLCSMGQYEEARRHHERALAIYESVLGPEHPDTATSLNHLAGLLASTGQYEEARPLFERALAIGEKALGPEHPATARSLNNLAVCAFDLGRLTESRRLAAACRSRSRAYSAAQAAQASISDASRVLAHVGKSTELLLSVTPREERGLDSVYGAVVETKGAVLRLLATRQPGAETAPDPELEATHERLRSIRAVMSNLFSLVEIRDREQHELDIERLRHQREECERRIATTVAARPDLQPVTPAEVRAALPKGAALLGVLEHAPYEPAEWKEGKVARLGKWGERRYSAWISRAGATESAYVDLGPSAAIEKAIREYLDAAVGVYGAGALKTRAPRQALEASLRQLLWDPIAAAVSDAKQILIAPDGALATLPFGLIVDEGDHPLIEKYAITQVDDVSSLARPLHPAHAASEPPRAAPPQPHPSLLVAGAIDYERGAALEEGLVSSHELRGSFTQTWDPLSETRREADGVAARHQRRFADAARALLLEEAPTEERLKSELPKYDVLHLATHGYFLVKGLKSITDSLRESEERDRFESPEHRLVASYWPEFLCGLVCAGANHPQPDRDNGLLTGDEVSSLDLSHCDLVVLSACETALGKRQAGEGMLSLTRSFRVAGAKTVISSLWQVRDDSTKELMLAFYDRLWTQGESKLDALRGAQLEMLRRNREKHGDMLPATWGAFVLTGDPE
jgi:CHAT domain-containing protein/tetratricopeptide (TPR) repeat protein